MAVLLAIVYSSGYTVLRIVSGYRDHRDALSIFGKTVRDQAQKEHWRVEVIGESDEGAPLYFDRPHFIEPERAVAEWNAGNLDALALPETDATWLTPQLRGAVRPVMHSLPRKELPKRPNYVLLTH